MDAAFTSPGLKKGGAGFLFFGEYFKLVKESQTLCEKEGVTEEELFQEAKKFSALYAHYSAMPQEQTGVDHPYLMSLCAAGCDLLDRRMKALKAERADTRLLERDSGEEVER